MIREATFYSIQCDYPECTYNTEDISEYRAWKQLEYAIEEWQGEGDGLYVREADGTERFYCNAHTTWDDDADEPVPLPEGIEGQFMLAEQRIRHVIESATERALTAHHKRIAAWERREAKLASDRKAISKWLGFGDADYTRLGPLGA
jgi:hypothetical protein